MRRYAYGLAVILAIPLCMGQSCADSFLGAVVDSINDGTDDSTDDNGTDTTGGVPEGSYSGTETIVETFDNVTDAYAAETHTSEGAHFYTFGTDGRLLDANDDPVAVGSVAYTDTLHGEVAEVVTSIGLGTNVTQYTTQASMTMSTSGLTWTFTGTGVHTFRLSGGKVLYGGSVVLNSDTAGGAAYELTIEHTATLTSDDE